MYCILIDGIALMSEFSDLYPLSLGWTVLLCFAADFLHVLMCLLIVSVWSLTHP